MRFNPIRFLHAHPCRATIAPRHLRKPSPTILDKLHKYWVKGMKDEAIDIATKVPMAFAVGGLVAVLVDEKVRNILLRGGKGGDGGTGGADGIGALIEGLRDNGWLHIVFQYDNAVGFNA